MYCNHKIFKSLLERSYILKLVTFLSNFEYEKRSRACVPKSNYSLVTYDPADFQFLRIDHDFIHLKVEVTDVDLRVLNKIQAFAFA